MDRILGRALLAVFLVVAAAVILSSENSRAQTATPSSKPHPPDAVQATQPSPGQPSAPIDPNAPHISKQTRYEIIRDFETQLVYARTAFPMGMKGLQLKQGVVTPNGEELQQALNLWGPAVKPGDPAHISFVQIKNDHIHFELNGGPIRRQKWYQRIEVSGANGPLNTGPNEPQSNPHGSYLDVYFDKFVPEMTAAQLRGLLYPALDF